MHAQRVVHVPPGEVRSMRKAPSERSRRFSREEIREFNLCGYSHGRCRKCGRSILAIGDEHVRTTHCSPDAMRWIRASGHCAPDICGQGDCGTLLRTMP